LPEDYCVRFSLCCGKKGCRKRVLPKSVLFDGRKVYWRAMILVTVLLREQRASGFTMRRLGEQFGVDFKTIRRWVAEYRQAFLSGRYKRIRGSFATGLDTGAEVSGLFSFFVTQNDSTSGVVRLLTFIAENEHVDPGTLKSPQKMGSFQGQN
jgi:hypothetical protein